jgi:hypothetical protein
MSGAADMVEGLGVERAWLQRVFDRGFAGLRSQGFKQSRYPKASGDSACAYRADLTPVSPVRCFAGHLMLDEKWEPALEGQTVCQIYLADRTDVFAEDVRPRDDMETGALADLQSIHDNADRPGMTTEAAIEAGYRDFARDHGLSIPTEASATEGPQS